MPAVLVPLDEYLKSDYEPDAEYVDGLLEERPMGEFDHASWQDALQAWFRGHAEDWKLRARPELRVQVSGTRYRVPDITVLDRSLPPEQIVTVPPVAVFEILSPEDRMPRILRKLADYERMGIRNIFVLDTETPLFYQYAEGKLAVCATDRVALADARGFVDWKEIAALLY